MATTSATVGSSLSVSIETRSPTAPAMPVTSMERPTIDDTAPTRSGAAAARALRSTGSVVRDSRPVCESIRKGTLM